MLANLRVGTKLAAILLAPLVVLGVLAGLGIADRAQAAAELRNAEREALLTARNNDLQNALQIEQLWAATSLSRPNQTVQDRFDDAVAASDAAAARLNDAVAQLSRSSELDEYLQTVADRLAGLEGLRPAIKSRSATVDAILTGYDQVGTSLIGLQAATAGNIDVAELSNNLDDASTLAKAKATKARRDALLSVLNTSTDEAAKQGYAAEINGLDADTSRYLAQFYEEADPDYRALLRNAEAASDARTVEDAATQMLAGRTVDSLNFTEASVSRLAGMLSVEERITTDVSSLAATSRADATRTAQLYLAGAVAGILLAVAVAFFVARSITRPLRRLTEAADRLATDQLPSLVDQLRAGATDVNLSYTPIELGTRDELGQLATSFNTVQQVTVEVAHEQSALLRKGISDIFVNLARRNQALLDRQIEFIDQLEANERDPDQLENLFRLDHLATRMRRNAESLLVLAGADPVRRRGRPVPLADVIRVAVGEVADYSRIRVRDLEDVTVNSAAAVDVAHLLAELMENATQFSPPNTQVEISGYFDRSGSLGYAVSVTDQGIGISPEHLHEFNDLLADPPAMGLDMSRSLGFVVIGRLAKRHGVDVRLSSPHEGGVLATVLLPEAILGSGRSGATTASGLPSRRGEVADPGAVAAAAGLPGPDLVLTDNGAEVLDGDAEDDAWTDSPAARRAPDSLFTAGNGSTRPAEAPRPAPAADHGPAEVSTPANGSAPAPHSAPMPATPPAPAAEPAPIGAEAESFTYYDVEEGYGALSDLGSPSPDEHAPSSLHSEAPPAPVVPPAPAVAPAAFAAPAAVPFDVTDNEAEDSFAALAAPPPAAPPSSFPAAGPVLDEHEPVTFTDDEPATAVAPTGVNEAGNVDDEATDAATDEADAVDEEPTPSLPSRAPRGADVPAAGAVESDRSENSRSLFSAESMTRAAAAAAELRTAARSGRETPADGAFDDAPQLPSRRSAGLAPAAGAAPTAPPSPMPDRQKTLDRRETADPRTTPAVAMPPAARNGTGEADLVDLSGPADAGRAPAGERPGNGLLAGEPLPARQAPEAPSRPAAGIAGRGLDPSDDQNLTAAGLVRRSPKQQLRAMARGENQAATRVAASQRSPEEVRKMLSRYRSGLQRGRTTSPPGSGQAGLGTADVDDDPNLTDLAPVHDHAAEELPWRP